MAEQAIYSQLTAIPALGDRVYPLKLPQNVEYPAATYQRISAPRVSAFGGDIEPVEATIQVDVYSPKAKGWPEFKALFTSVRVALQRRSSGDTIQMFLDADRDDYEDDTDLYRKSTCGHGTGRRR